MTQHKGTYTNRLECISIRAMNNEEFNMYEHKRMLKCRNMYVREQTHVDPPTQHIRQL